MNPHFGPILVILIALVLGFILRRIKNFPPDSPRVLNAYVISVALPAVVLSQLPPFLRRISAGEFDGTMAVLPLVPWVIFFVAAGFFGFLYRLGFIQRDQWALLTLSAGLGNTSFVGIPLIEALLGSDQVPHAILLDQLGTFLTLSTVGIFWIAFFQGGTRPSPGDSFMRLMRFPPFLAMLGAFFVATVGEWPVAIQSALERIGSTLVPVALVSVGAQLEHRLSLIREERAALLWGLGFKMVLAPLFIFALLTSFGTTGPSFEVSVLESAMAPMITSTVLAIDAGFAPRLGALMLGIGIPLSVATVPLIRWLLLIP